MDKKNNTVFEYSFDFERYIKERTREIEDLEERQFAKTLLLDGLGKSIQCIEEKYCTLEQKTFEEIVIPDNRYEITCTIVEKSHFDSTNDTLFPVSLLDFDENELRRQLSGETEIYIETIFLELSEQELRLLDRDKGEITGCLKIGDGQEEVLCVLRPVSRYRHKLQQLYKIFRDNDVKWNTVNTAYIDKFFDVFVKASLLDMSVSIEDKGQPEILFKNWEGAAKHGMLPLWNVQEIFFESVSFMTPCSDGIHFEHEFILKGKDLQDKIQKDGYLIEKNDDITEIHHDKNKIILYSTKGTFKDWVAYRVAQEESIRSVGYTWTLLTNRKKDSFFRRYALKANSRLMTKTDIFRRITELNIEEFLEVIDYQICDDGKSLPFVEGMNWFIHEELIPMDTRKILVFFFKEINPGYYLNDAIVRFVISQMQTEINEYRCAGEVTKGLPMI